MPANILDQMLIPMQKNIKPLDMNGLRGRMLKLPAPKNRKREILLLYGHHASIERIYGIAEVLNEFGAVTVPDLPGFGGMDSFYKIGMKPTLDNYADYLASFLKLKYKRKKVTIVGMSLGFVFATRMLQRYPELKDKVDLVVSVVGFAHHSDMKFSKTRHFMFKAASGILAMRIPNLIYSKILLQPFVIRSAYDKSYNAKSKFEHLDKEEKEIATEFEIKLWQDNDPRTHMKTANMMLKLDICNKQVDLPLEHISVNTDQYFDHTVVEQHLRIIYNDFNEHSAILKNHAPSVIANKEEAKPFIPESVKKLLRKKL